MQLPNAILLATAASVASALNTPAEAPSRLSKRCSPEYNPEYHRGFLPPAPCWHSFNTACVNYVTPGTEQFVSEARRTAVVMGVSEYCFADIAEEQARQADGRKTWGWREKHGKLTRVSGTDILVISEMPDSAIAAYKAMA